MARLWQSGWEQNSVAQEGMGNSGGLTVDTVTVRSGTYSLKITGLTSGSQRYCRYQFSSANANGPYYFRAFIQFNTLPSAANEIIRLATSSVTTKVIGITIDNTGVLQLSDEDGNIGSPSSPLATGTWYRIEIKIDRTGSSGAHIVEAKLDGTIFATASNRALSVGVQNFMVGGNIAQEAQTTGVWWFDDLAINDTTGSFQTGYPGLGHIIHLKPNASGDSNGFLTQVGGTAGSSNNYTRVNEITPNDATSYNASSVLNSEDLFNCDDSGIGSGDTVNVVAVGVRMADLLGADTTAGFKLEIEKTGSGTKSQSGNLIPNSTSWITNQPSNPRNYPLVTYQDPDSNAWTQTTLDSMQIGYIIDATNVDAIGISTVWASVDYTPASETTTSTSSTTSTSTTSTSSSTSTSTTTTSTSTSSTTTSSSTSTSTTTTSTSTSSTTTSSSTSTSTTTTSSSTSTSSTTTSTSSSTSTTTTSTSTTSSTSTSTTTTSTSTTSSTSTSSTTTSTSTSSTTSTSTTTTSTSTSSSTSTSTSTTSSTSTSTSTTTTSTSTTTTSTSTTIPFSFKVEKIAQSPVKPISHLPPINNFLLTEDGGYLLQEDGAKIIVSTSLPYYFTVEKITQRAKIY